MDSYCIGALVALDTRMSESYKRFVLFDILLGIIGIFGYFSYAGYLNNLGFIQSYQFFANSSNYTHDRILVNIYLFLGVLSAVLMRLCLAASDNSLLSNKWIVTLGNWSYELYLFHYLFIYIVKNTDNGWLVAAISLPLTIITAFLWHKYAEEQI